MFRIPFRISFLLLATISFITLFDSNGLAQSGKYNRKVFDEKSKSNIMIGYCTLEGITDTGFLSAFHREYASYNPEKKNLNQMYNLLDGITVTIVLGTWCIDSREEVPKFMKLFDELEHSFETPLFICVDRNKKADDISLDKMNILKVPTFIVYYHDREIGRIVEKPETTLDEDFLRILKK